MSLDRLGDVFVIFKASYGWSSVYQYPLRCLQDLAEMGKYVQLISEQSSSCFNT